MRSRRVVWPERGVAEVEEWEVREPRAGEMLLRTRVSLISPGTERAFFLGLPNTPQRYPQYPGYSSIGEVLAVGEGVEGWSVGDRVACTAGHAAHALVSILAARRVPEGLADEEASFFQLTAIAMQGVRKARLELGESVAVIGAGVIGLLALQLAQLQGGLPVVAVDGEEKRLEFARTIGADGILKADEETLQGWRELTGEEGARVVIEATGSPSAILLAFHLAAWHGRVVLLGSTRGETEAVNFYRDVHRKGLTVIGAHNSVRPQHESSPGFWTAKEDQLLALRLLTLGRLRVRPLLTHRFAGEEAPQAYALLAQARPEVLGILLDWR